MWSDGWALRLEQRSARGVAVRLLLHLKMIICALYKKRTEQLACFWPISLILQPRLTGTNEKGFKAFLAKNAAQRSFRPHMVASLHKYTREQSKTPLSHTYTHTPPPVSPVHTGQSCLFFSFYILSSSVGVGWCWSWLRLIHALVTASKHLRDGRTTEQAKSTHTHTRTQVESAEDRFH